MDHNFTVSFKTEHYILKYSPSTLVGKVYHNTMDSGLVSTLWFTGDGRLAEYSYRTHKLPLEIQNMITLMGFNHAGAEVE